MKKVIVLGGGFAGITAIQNLLKHHKSGLFEIILIDRNPFHLFTPALYEVATSEEFKRNIAIPYSEIFTKKVKFVQGQVTAIDTKKQVISLFSGEKYEYDGLIFTLGSESAYYNIPGVEKYGITLKSLEDAIKIKTLVKESCCTEGVCHRTVNVVIGGGGFSGTELAAELLSYKDKLAKQHNLDKNCLDVYVIQGSDRLLKELDPHVSKIAEKRMTHPQMHFCFGAHIKEVTKKMVKTDDGKEYPYHIFIWTGGIAPNGLATKSGLPVTKQGKLIVDESLQVQGYPNIFAAGDIAAYTNPKTNELVPAVAEVAEDEGIVAGENMYRFFAGKKLKKYNYIHMGYVVPLRGKYAAAELLGIFHIDGFLGWVLQQVIYLRYLFGILPPWKALKKWDEYELALQKQQP